MNDKEFRKLCIKAVSGNISDEEKKLLDNWLAESEESRNKFEEIKIVWSATTPDDISELPDANSEWNLLSERIRLSEKEEEKATTLNKFFDFNRLLFISKWKPALALTLVVVTSIIAGLLLSNKHEPQLKLISTSNKEHKSVQLPDGSTAYLNYLSTIEFADEFDEDNRSIKLNGEAFFSVVKNSRPFIVSTNNAKVTVLGTEFNVWARDEKTRVIVKEGKVKLGQTSGEEIRLSEGELSTLTKNLHPAQPEKVDAEYLLGWMDNKLVFSNTSLDEVILELERFYSVKIIIEDKGLINKSLTGKFSDTDINGVLGMICLALELDFKIQNENYLIISKGK
jgi:ferric-dicitrate binding protein FerR (iron transport regulator)